MKIGEFHKSKQHRPSILKLLIATTVLTSACTNLSQTQNNQPTYTPVTSNELSKNAPKAPETSADLQLFSRIGALPAQPLIEKGCALFLWASLPERTLVFYTDTETPNALMNLDNSQTKLARTNAAGLSYLGIAGEQSFTGPNLEMRLTFVAEQTKGFSGGAVVKQATLRMRDKEGWEIIMPVAGLIGCNNI